MWRTELKEVVTLWNSGVSNEVAYLIGDTSLLTSIWSRPASEHAEIFLPFNCERFGKPGSVLHSCLELELTTFKKWMLFSEVIERNL